MDSERTTQHLIEALGHDYTRSYQDLLGSFDDGEIDEDGNLDADYEYHARQLIRAAFAYIEAVTFSLKASAAWKCIQNRIEITPEERYFATDTEHELNEKGEIVQRGARISLARNMR